MPGYLAPTSLPFIGTSVMRITDGSAFGFSSRFYKHAYSKRQVWNSDGSRIFLGNHYPAIVLDGRTFRYLHRVSQPFDAQWSHSDPDIMEGVRPDIAAFVRLRVSTGAIETIRTFPEYSMVYIGGGEGNLSEDDRYVALIGRRSGGVDVLVYDQVANQVVSLRQFNGFTGPYGDIDNATMSPSGAYVVLGMNVGGTGRYYDVYDRQTMTFQRRLTDGISHADIGYDSQGYEVLVTQTGNPAITSVRLADGVPRVELPVLHMANNQHISCRNNLRRGWCYVSTYSHGSEQNRVMYKEIFAIKLDGSQTVERFTPSYFAQDPSDLQHQRAPMAVPRRDGTLVMFASDWGNGSSSATIHTYVAGMRVVR